MTGANPERTTYQPPTENTFSLKKSIKAYDAGAKIQPEWLEGFLITHLKTSGIGGTISESEKTLLKYFLNGVSFFINAREINLNESTASPLDSFRTISDIGGFLSGLNLHENENPPTEGADDDLIRRTKWHRLGFAIAGSLPKGEIPAIESKSA